MSCDHVISWAHFCHFVQLNYNLDFFILGLEDNTYLNHYTFHFLLFGSGHVWQSLKKYPSNALKEKSQRILLISKNIIIPQKEPRKISTRIRSFLLFITKFIEFFRQIFRIFRFLFSNFIETSKLGNDGFLYSHFTSLLCNLYDFLNLCSLNSSSASPIEQKNFLSIHLNIFSFLETSLLKLSIPFVKV